MDAPRIVVHADMDAFYAAVEQLDDPGLRGRPVLVGPPGGRGVVLTASYEARPYGVGSAMPMVRARQRCPQAIVVPPRFRRYQEISRQVMAVFRDFSPQVEPLSLDEAFLEMSGSEHIFGPPEEMGRRIKQAVREATGGLAVSVGVSATKYVAKVASDLGKPDGILVVPGEEARAFLAPLPVSRLWGAGPKTAARLEALGLRTIGDVAAADRAWLERHLGSAGSHFHSLSHACDPRAVIGGRRAVSIGCERTLDRDIEAEEAILLHLRRAADTIGRRLRKQGLRAGGVRVKLKTRSFRSLSRQRALASPTDLALELFEAGSSLIGRFEHREPYRLVGMAAYDLRGKEPSQGDLFDLRPPQARLERAVDAAKRRFGGGALFRAEDLENPQGLRLSPNMDDILGDPDGAPPPPVRDSSGARGDR